MKYIFITLGLALGSVLGLQAQDCATGYCPPTITVHHYALQVSAATTTITYGVVQTSLSGADKCWITRNLGATATATLVSDNTEAVAGWYYQFNRSDARSPSFRTNWSANITEDSNWVQSNDPCYLLLGNSWRLPTSAEWLNVKTNASITNTTTSFASVLHLNTSGYLLDNAISSRGMSCYYWSSTQATNSTGNAMGNITIVAKDKLWGMAVRCLRDL